MTEQSYRGHRVGADRGFGDDAPWFAYVDGEEVGSAASDLAALDLAKSRVRRTYGGNRRRERKEIVDDAYMKALRDSLR